ncbi:RNA polymerase sigma factor [Agromyces sp. H66]|uniref:RNA polymerase sigma factor n=1 Tax=Agromyces sp. H66 TaxID=2529859 RepID=UPI0010A9EA34|nr:RNA polymerase sigma factor [Agromyces sp. H66]
MTTADDEDWARALGGDGEAFGRIFDRHHTRIRRHVHGLVPTAADADDVVATTFLEAWRRRDGIRFVNGSMLPWLLRTATNVSRNVTRSTRRHRNVLARLPVDASTPDHADGDYGDGPATRSLALLSLQHQHVVTLCVLEGLTTDEAANLLGVSAGTVRSRLSRAKAQLRAHISNPIPRHPLKGATDEL